MHSKPETVANVSVKEYCFSKKQIKGVVEASQFKWTFTWSFNRGCFIKIFIKKRLRARSG